MSDKPESVLGDLPEGVENAMFLRDGWPDAVVCKVVMKTGCVGIGLFRFVGMDKVIGPDTADQLALADAVRNVAAAPPDYTEVVEHIARQAAAAQARARSE